MKISVRTQPSPLIQAHAYIARAAIGLGAAQLAAQKGTSAHRALARIGVALMPAIAGTSLFIHTIRSFGPFSAIHLLSLWSLAVVPAAVLAAPAGRIAQHRIAMTSIYVLALLVTGRFTLWPGRIMHKVIFGG